MKVDIKSKAEIDRMREACRMSAEIRDICAAAVANGVKSIAFPSIATGVSGYPAEDAARIAIREVKAFLADHPDLEVTFVLFNGPRDRIDMKALYDRLLSS